MLTTGLRNSHVGYEIHVLLLTAFFSKYEYTSL